jgi:hypothetical protein
MAGDAVVPLAQGLWRDGVRHARAVLRPLTGADEMRLDDPALESPLAVQTTAILGAAVSCIGDVTPIAATEIRALTVGDRDRLLLALHALTFGPRIEAVVCCSVEGCGALMEVDLNTDDLFIAPAATGVAAEHELDAEAAGRVCRVHFRLPTGGDQEAVARVAVRDPAQAGETMLRRLVLAVTDRSDRIEPTPEVLADLKIPLADAIRRIDPQVETTLRLACPECEAETTALLDVATFVFRKLTRFDEIVAEVDQLARLYHWSEAEILALPVARRRRYLGFASAAAATT